jgi:hypothetical protein
MKSGEQASTRQLGAGITSATYTRDAIYLVRTATQANIALSQMADHKASILMGATFLVFTVTIGQAASGTMTASLLILACAAFFSAFFAVAAIMPSVKPPKSVPGAENRLFFGVFTKWSEADFTDRMLDIMRTDEDVLRTMLRDIYQNGRVLERKKYRFLGFAYRVFLSGLVLTLLAFLTEQSIAFLVRGTP